MILEEFLKSIKGKKSKNDLLHIYAEETLKNGSKISLSIDDIFIKKHPLILKADLIKYGEEITQASDFITKDNFNIKIYYAIVDLDQYNIARKDN